MNRLQLGINGVKGLKSGLTARRFLSQTILRRSGASGTITKPQFNSNQRKSKWIPWTIFGTSFVTGWFFTQHMTFTDVLAWWRYDTLPKNSTEVKDYEAQLLARLEKLSIIKQLKSKGFVEVFPSSLTQSKNTEITEGMVGQALRSPGAIAIEPKFYYNPETHDTVGVYHLGMKLTGYPFIVHGGILATVMEDLMRHAMLIRGGNSDFLDCEKTRDLNISYKFPTFANQFVIVRTTKTEQFGQGTKMRCEILDQTGNNTLVTGGAVFTKK